MADYDSMQSQRVNILGCPVCKLNMAQILSLVDEAIQRNEQIYITGVDASKIILMNKNREFYKSVLISDIIHADGQSIVCASRVLGDPLPERVAGIDLMDRIINLAYRKSYKIFFLGAEEDVVAKVINVYSNKYTPNIIAGYRNGYFSPEDEHIVAKEVASSGANILFIGISSPKKEGFVYRNKQILKNVNIIMGVGGSFDVIAGKVKRAPKWMQIFGLEWFWRFLQEPKRMWKRAFIYNFQFIVLVVRESLKSKLKLIII